MCRRRQVWSDASATPLARSYPLSAAEGHGANSHCVFHCIHCDELSIRNSQTALGDLTTLTAQLLLYRCPLVITAWRFTGASTAREPFMLRCHGQVLLDARAFSSQP